MVLKIKFKKVRKRDGRVVAFDKQRIINAISKAMAATGEGDLNMDPNKVTDQVLRILNKRYKPDHILHIEEIQDVVEECLILMDFPKTAKAYILYRQKRAEIREKKKAVPEDLKKLIQESKKYFQDPYCEFIYFRTYSRWLDDKKRRETWIETVDRYINFMKENLKDKLTESEYEKIRQAILNQKVMPSMRLLWSAGKAARLNNAAAYNCSFVAPTKIKDFAEIMYLSMSGAGVGFSVESHICQQLPIIKYQTGKMLKTHIVEDSKEGWCNALTVGMKAWFSGKDIKFDFSKVRPVGARLKTMGGRASGPGPLRSLLEFTRDKILSRQGKRLSNLDVHDIICKIGEAIVAGGVRRTAMISLSDLDDEEMRRAKEGQFFLTEPQRQMANNSAVYNEKPSTQEFLKEWLALAESGTGERGIFNRGSIKNQLPKRRLKNFKKYQQFFGTNPCGEILLRNKEFCNLTEVVARPEDTEKTLLEKIKFATVLGTYQSMLTNFSYLSPEWQKNCEEERLLGVSITGQWDCPVVRNPKTLRKLREYAIKVNRYYAKKFGINPSRAVTCVKPSGTVSQLVNCSSGMHPRHSRYYIRRVRIAASDPLFQMLKDQKVPYYPEVGQSIESATTYVLEFPIEAPRNSVFRKDLTAIKQLEYWKMVKENYTEHNPSVTISIGPNEWIEVANWLYKNWEILGGLSFLPKEEHIYPLAPYEEITKEEYLRRKKEFPEIDFSQIIFYEKDDKTEGAKEYACVGGTCELNEIPELKELSKT